MADRAKRFKPCKIRVRTKSTKGRTITKIVRVKAANYNRLDNSNVTSLGVESFVFMEESFDSTCSSPNPSSYEVPKNEKPGGLSKHHLRRVKEYNSWEVSRESLLQARIEEEAFSNGTVCIECHVNIAVCRCVDCGSRQYLCMDCAKVIHEKRNHFHLLEIYQVCNCFRHLLMY